MHAAQALHCPRVGRSLRCKFSAAPLTRAKSRTLRWVYTVDVTLRSGEGAVLRRCRSAKITREAPYRLPHSRAAPQRSGPWSSASARQACSPRSCWRRRGCGPSCSSAATPHRCAGKRSSASGDGGPLDPESNVQFGEGGAGTFSDGKLNTGTKNERGRWVLEQFVRFGAQRGNSLRRQAARRHGCAVPRRAEPAARGSLRARRRGPLRRAADGT